VRAADLAPGLGPLLGPHLARQRWYGAKHRPGAAVEVLSVEEVRPPWPAIVRVVVGTDDESDDAGDLLTGEHAAGDHVARGHAAGEHQGERGRRASGLVERYQLVLGIVLLDQPHPTNVDDSALVGVLSTPQGPAMAFDALTEPGLAVELLHHIAADEDASAVRPITAEQSNSSLVYDERLILKLYRRLSGANPEVEVTLALAANGFAHVAAPVAVWRAGADDLAVVQRFLVGGVDGWALARTSVRGLLDEGVAPADAGGDMGPEAERLGAVTAEMHRAMADAFGTEPGDAGAWADGIIVRAASVDHVDIDTDEIGRALRPLRALDDAGAAVRVHGDYHLGQVMRTDDGWFVLDFEGEPARPVDERRRRSSPLRDVAGMLRSFGYAAAVGAREHGGGDGAAELAVAWEHRNRDSFVGAYLARLEGSPLVPGDASSVRVLLDAFELDKAVYEVAYEQAHRPDWVGVPLGALRRLLDNHG